MKIASDISKSCEACSGLEDGGHYCLLHSITVKNADLHVCGDWMSEDVDDE